MFQIDISPRGSAHFKGLFWSFVHLYLSTWCLPLSLQRGSTERTSFSDKKWKLVFYPAPQTPHSYRCLLAIDLLLNSHATGFKSDEWMALNLKRLALKTMTMASSHVLISGGLLHICWKLINNCSHKHIEVSSASDRMLFSGKNLWLHPKTGSSPFFPTKGMNTKNMWSCSMLDTDV